MANSDLVGPGATAAQKATALAALLAQYKAALVISQRHADNAYLQYSVQMQLDVSGDPPRPAHGSNATVGELAARSGALGRGDAARFGGQ